MKPTITRAAFPGLALLLYMADRAWEGADRNEWEIDPRWEPWLPAMEKAVLEMSFTEMQELAETDNNTYSPETKIQTMLNAFVTYWSTES